MFSCGEVAALADAYIDGELFTNVRAQAVRHLMACRACAALIEEKAELKRLVRVSVRTLTAPLVLWQTIRNGMGAQ
jgi:anti-sigma factor RsiW